MCRLYVQYVRALEPNRDLPGAEIYLSTKTTTTPIYNNTNNLRPQNKTDSLPRSMSTLTNPLQTDNSSVPNSNSHQTDPSSPMLSHPLTLIVATTPIASSSAASATAAKALTTRLGIGNKNTLPWPRVKSDMSFFARVTSRVQPTTTTTTTSATPENDAEKKKGMANAIVMGRRTYFSLPESLRPLARRVNVVLTREGAGGEVEGDVMKELKLQREKRDAARREKGGGSGEVDTTDAVVGGSLETAITELQSLERRAVGNIFVIGGADIYASALRLSPDGFGRGMRVVMTKILRKKREGETLGHQGVGEEQDFLEGFVPVGGYECDTFFPVEDFSEASGWREASAADVSGWVGEEVHSGWRDEGEVATKIVGYERL